MVRNRGYQRRKTSGFHQRQSPKQPFLAGMSSNSVSQLAGNSEYIPNLDETGGPEWDGGTDKARTAPAGSR
jgi:hypothetical protein